MKIKIVLFAILLIMLNCSSENPQQSDQLAIQQLIKDYSKAFNAKDFPGFISYCSNDFMFFSLDGQVFDRSSTVPFLERIIDHWSDVHSELNDLEIQVDDTLALARYQLVFTFISKGQSGSMKSLITAGFVKSSDQWQLSHFHMSQSYR
ncbi:MAG: nuclear transport factor 2 family protein [bacterium]|nr:nuclear transport factor 2 family protein [bacterium]